MTIEINIQLSNLELNKLKHGIKNGTEINLRCSSNVVSDSHDKNSFQYKLLLTNTQVLRFRKAFANGNT